jgi:hypothetical protein
MEEIVRDLAEVVPEVGWRWRGYYGRRYYGFSPTTISIGGTGGTQVSLYGGAGGKGGDDITGTTSSCWIWWWWWWW